MASPATVLQMPGAFKWSRIRIPPIEPTSKMLGGARFCSGNVAHGPAGSHHPRPT